MQTLLRYTRTNARAFMGPASELDSIWPDAFSWFTMRLLPLRLSQRANVKVRKKEKLATKIIDAGSKYQQQRLQQR